MSFILVNITSIYLLLRPKPKCQFGFFSFSHPTFKLFISPVVSVLKIYYRYDHFLLLSLPLPWLSDYCFFLNYCNNHLVGLPVSTLSHYNLFSHNSWSDFFRKQRYYLVLSLFKTVDDFLSQLEYNSVPYFGLKGLM